MARTRQMVSCFSAKLFNGIAACECYDTGDRVRIISNYGSQEVIINNVEMRDIKLWGQEILDSSTKSTIGEDIIYISMGTQRSLFLDSVDNVSVTKIEE